MNKIAKAKLLSFFLFIFLFFMTAQSLFAQTTEIEANKINETLSEEEIEEIFLNDELGGETNDSSVTVATINLYEAEILKQENNKFDLSFLITNREKAQPSIKYAIQLVTKNEAGDETVIDEKIYPEVLNLGENSEIRKKIHYEAPEYLNGKYFLNVVSKTEEGLMLGFNSFGEVSLNGNSEYVEVLSPTCFLSIEREGNDKKYDLRQGVAVKPDEILKLNCEVENHSNEDVVLSYSSSNFYRSVFGKKASSNETYKEITEIKPKERKNIAVEIPKEDQPQAYDAVVHFKTDKGFPVNNITIHYVLSGKSASIVNLLLDKNFYNKGEQAEISFFYVGPADNFPGSRLGEGASIEKIVAHLKIKNGEGQLCGPEINPELNQEEVDNKFKYQIDQVCAHPTVGVILKDGISGEVLAESNFSFTSPEEFVKKATAVETETTDEKDSAVILVLIIFGGLIVFLVGVFLLIKKRNKLVLKVLLLLFFSGFCFLNEAKADSVWLRYSVKEGGTSGFVKHDFLFNYSLNKRVYSPGENVTAKAQMSNIACWNAVNRDFIKITLPPHTSPYGIRYDYGSSSLSFTKAAPTTPGTYYAGFYWEDLRYRFAKNFPTSGTFFDSVYYANKAVQLNSIRYEGRTNWTAAEAEAAIRAAGLTAWSHYLKYGKAEGVDGYLYAYNHSIYTSDFSGDAPDITKKINFTVTAPTPAPTPVNGSCGTNAKNYSYTTTRYPSTTNRAFCSTGTPSPTASRIAFPAQGSSQTWRCTGSSGGYTTTCWASRGAAPAPTNTSPQAVIDTPTTNQTITTGGSVSFSGHGTDSDGDAITAYRWRLSNCSTGTLLSSGSSFSRSFTTAGTYTIYLSVQDSKGAWSTNCPSRTITVTKPITYSCTGTRPANTSIHSGDTTGLTADTSWAYSATNTSRKCQYYCNSGYTWNGSLCRLNAACGSANGGSYCNAPPTEDLCAVGSSSTVTSTSGNWTWTCSSVSVTTQDDASCSATVQTTDCGSPGDWREANP